MKTKALISCTVTVQLICAFVFAYAKSRFSHDAIHIVVSFQLLLVHFGADISSVDNEGNTPLHMCAMNGHEDVSTSIMFTFLRY